MDFSKKYDNPNPEPQANILSKLFFTWEIPLIRKRLRSNLQIQDLYNARHSDRSETLADALEINWNKELEKAKLKGRKPKLINALYQTFKKAYWICGVLLFLHALFIRSITPVILSKLLLYFDIDDVTVTKQEGIICGVLLVLFTFSSSTIMFHCGTMLRILGMRGRIAACSVMYRKMLRLSQTALNEAATGKVVNLMSNDVNRFDPALELIHYIWIIPFQMVVVSYFMFMTMGYAAFGGILVIGLQAEPIQGMISRKIAQLRSIVAKRTDERVRLMNEIVNGIQVIKMYAWEKPFEAVVRASRKHEIDVLLISSYLRGLSAALIAYIERCALFVTIVIYVSLGNNLNANEVFSMAQFFNTLQMYFALFFSQAVIWRNEGLVSVKRIEEFLLLEENNEAGSICNTYGTAKSGTIQLQNINATWGGQSTTQQTLCDINLNIKPGQLCAIIGPVGSGKSSILNLLLRELPLSSGVMNVNGRISFCPQVPWLFQGSIRNNVLFGQEYDEYKYNETVKVCALQRDFELFPFGDKTLVGDRGASLSGGQKARVNLARTVYREADIYLFDDPCSAVDTHVGKHLFDQCIYKYLSNKTRILVTHQLQYLKDADLIIVLKNGSIVKTGSWDDISKDESIVECIKTSEVEYDQKPPHLRQHTLSECSELITAELEEEEEELKAQAINKTVDGEPQEVGESMETGTMRFKLFWKYMRAGASVSCLIFLTILLLLAQTACTGADYWLTLWTNWEDIRRYYMTYIGDSEVDSVPLNLTTEINATLIQDDPYLKSFAGQVIWEQYNSIYVYAILIVLSIIITTLSRLLLYKVAMKSSTNLHDSMFTNILQATMRFFDTNPSGRILNRFSKDMGAIDELLPRALLDATQILISMVGIATMVALVNPWLIVIMVVAGILFKKLAIMYMKTAQDIKRLESVTRSPAFSQVSTSLNGITTIRSCGAQAALQKQFDEQQDVHTGAFYMTILLTSGFGYWLDCVCMTFLGFVTFSFLFYGSTFSGNVGLAISQTMALTGVLQYGIRQCTEVMTQLTSVERVLQYTNLPKEDQYEAEPAKETADNKWPSRGKVEFKHTYLTYVPEEGPILKDLNVHIIPGDKIGIVGRTGAGKSSLISALFRLAPLDGQICIDGVDSKSVALADLRSKISIIPQTPVLFSATLRYNLDPFNDANDDALWRALEEVELKDVVDNLDCKVNEGGSNFSVGQRQLLCLARAIVRNNKVLVLDEATANVDLRTDALIQTTIRQKFTHCTVLTIAHRLNTIMDSDKVLVMDAGSVKEYDHPYILLQDSESYFSKMVAETGKSMEMQLRQIALESFENSNNTKL